jgi:hypothetical protein
LGYDAKIRAMAIARTEVTGAFNAGHDATYRALAADGLISGKTWLATLDGDARETHARNHEKTVPADGEFDVGGHSAPYPGHHKLPAKERVRCRCTTVAAFEDAIVVPVAKPKPTPEEKPKPPKSGPLAELRNKLDAIVKSPEWLAEMERQKTFDAENNKGADIREEAARRAEWFSKHRPSIREILEQATRMTYTPKGKSKVAAALSDEASELLSSTSPHQVYTQALKVPQSRRAEISIDVSGKMAKDAKQKEKIAEAREFLNSIADKDVIGKVSTVKCRHVAEDNAKSGLSSDDRAYCRNATQTAYYNSKADTSTHIHETGHHLEYEIPGLQKAVNEFHAKVTAGSERVHMGKGYDADEFYFPRSDGKVWMHNYMGKDYSAWKHGPDKTHATELTSMGVQYLYECPSSLAKSDPELFDILVDHLRGHR